MSEAQMIDEEQEKRDILAQLIKDGLHSNASHAEQVQHFHRKLQRTEQQLTSTLDNMEELRRQQKEEMQAVETYVTHIRQLSEEREHLVSGLETENAQLKLELQRTASSAQRERTLSWQEVKEVLSDAELVEIDASAESEPKEVIRKLAKQRQEITTQCKVAQEQVESLQKQQHDLKIQLTAKNQELETEKKALQVKLRTSQQALASKLSQATSSFDEERERLVGETKRLAAADQATAEKFEALEQRVKQLKTQLGEQEKQHTEGVKQERLKAAADLAAVRTTHDKALKKVNEERNQAKSTIANLRVKVQVLEKDKATAQDRSSTANTSLSSERARCQRLLSSHGEDKVKWEEEKRHLQAEVEQSTLRLEELEAAKSSLEGELQQTTATVSAMEEKEDELQTKLEILSSEASTSQTSMSSKMEDAMRSRSAAERQLNVALEQVEQLQAEMTELRSRLVRAESSGKQERLVHARVVAEMKTQATELQEQLAFSKELASSSQKELSAKQQANAKELLAAQQQQRVLEGQVEDRLLRCRELETELDSTRKQLTGANETISSLRSTKLELEGRSSQQLTAAQQERDGIARQLSKVQEDHRCVLAQTEEQRDRIANLTSEVSQLSTAGEEARVLAAQKQQACDALAHRLEEQQTAAGEALLRCESLNQEFGEVQGAKEALQQNFTSLQSQISALVQELDEQKAAFSEQQEAHSWQLAEAEERATSSKQGLSEEVKNLAAQLQQTRASESSCQRDVLVEKERVRAATEEKSSLVHQNESLQTKAETSTLQLVTAQEKCRTLDEEKSKVWSQMRETQEKLLPLQAKNEAMQKQLHKKSMEHRQTSAYLATSEKDLESLQSVHEEQRRSLEIEQAKVLTLHEELARLQGKLEAIDQTMHLNRVQEEDSQRSRETIDQLRDSLHEIQTDRVLQEQSIAELKRRVSDERSKRELAKAECKHLSADLLHAQQKIKAHQQKWQRAKHQKRQSETESLGMLEQSDAVLAENRQLQAEIQYLNETVDSLEAKCAQLGGKHDQKLAKTKEKHTAERRSLAAQLSDVEGKLSLGTLRLQREEEWRVMNEQQYKQLLVDKRELTEQLAKSTSSSQDLARSVLQLESKIAVLEKENLALRTTVMAAGWKSEEQMDTSLASSKQQTDRLLRQFSQLTSSKLSSLSPMESSRPSSAADTIGSPSTMQDSFLS